MNFGHVLVVGQSTGVDSDVLLGFSSWQFEKKELWYQLMLHVLL